MPSKQKVNVTTTDDNSVVYADNLEIGKGPQFTTKVKKSGPKQIVVQTPGYKDEYITLMPEKRSPLFYPFLVLDLPTFVTGYGFLTLYVPKTFNYKKDLKFDNKIRYTKRESTEKYIDLSSIKLNIKDKNKDLQDYYVKYKGDLDANIEMAKVNRTTSMEKEALKAEKKARKKGTQNVLNANNELKSEDTEFSECIYKTLKKTEFIDTVNKVFQDDNNTLVLEGEIRKADLFHVYGVGYNSFQRLGVGMEWFIKNSYGEILDSVFIYEYSGDVKYSANYISTSGATNVNTKSSKHIIYDDAVENNYFKFLKSDEFKNNITLNTDFASKDEKLVLTEPKSLVKEVADASLASVIVKRKDKGHGSGFAITNDGYILTNFHVIAGKTKEKQEKLKVILSNGEELDAEVVRFNRARDIALLKVDYKFEKAFALKAVKEFKNLQEVYTIGAPKSIELGQTVTLGLISNERKTNNNNVLQLSMSINGGNSGGPLFEKTGVLHGVIQAKLVGFATEGVGFAIPSYMIPEYLNISYKK